MSTFRHAADLRVACPELATGALRVDGIVPTVDVAVAVARFTDVARTRLEGLAPGGLVAVRFVRQDRPRTVAVLGAATEG